MLVLLPYPHIGASARCFTNGDLLTQTALSGLCLKEMRTIRAPLLKPRVLMWLGYTLGLVSYANALRAECVGRGLKTEPLETIDSRMIKYVTMPPWFGDERVHISHQAALLRRNQNYYARYNWGTLPTYPILSPTSFVYAREHSRRTEAFDFSIFDST